MQDGAVKDDESIKHSDVLVEDPEKIEKHAKEPEELEKTTRNWRNFSLKSGRSRGMSSRSRRNC